jgi:putative ABC transport system permease protein
VIFALAWRNLWRQPRRTILSSLAIAFACMFLIFMPSLQNGTYNAMIENTMRLFDGYAEVQAPGYHDDPQIRKTIHDPQPLLAELRRLPGVRTASPRALSYALLSAGNHSYGAQIVGVQPDTEPGVSTVPHNVREGRYLQKLDSDEIVLGDTLAKNLRLKLGDSVTLLGLGRDGSLAADSLKLVGIYHTGIQDMDRLVAEIPLGRFQETFSMGNQIHAVALGSDSLSHIQGALSSVRTIAKRHGLVALDWKQLQPGLLQGILLDMSTGAMIYLAMVVVVAFSLLNSLLMSVLERTREFGVLMALGMRPGSIGRLVWIETLFMLAIGIGLGIALGFTVTEYFSHAGIYFGEAQDLFAQFGLRGAMYPAINNLTLLGGPAIIALSIALAGIYPVVRIRRLEPVPAMRTV